MLISVIIPTYNRAERLPDTLHSILAQTYPDIEIIVVDDGSTDNTRDVVAATRARYGTDLVYEYKPNGGCASARNRGIAIASGDYVAFLDSDDQWLPESLERLAGRLEQTGTDFVYSPYAFVWRNRREIMNRPVAAENPLRLAEEHFMNTDAHICAALFHRRIFAGSLRFNETLTHNEDSDCFQRIAIEYTGAYLNVPTLRVYRHAGNKSLNRVKIYRALIASAKNTLAEYPSFRERLGPLADRRIEKLHGLLAEALIRDGCFREAAATMETSGYPPGFPVSWCLSTHSGWPLFIRDLPVSIKRRFYQIRTRISFNRE
jgi:glycosyltransferase involved in cell wall biosynthesis